jgi:hypothetical protein
MGRDVTLVLRRAAASVVQRSQRMNHPNEPQPPKPNPSPQEEPKPAVNPDPKTHPIHREVPTQPIHEGTDPKQPVKPSP